MIAPNPQGQPATMSPGQASQLTSYLYGLKTPEAVQAYAAQHQNDINVVGIASGVANAMKRAQQQQQPQQVQPSVTQQAIAQMAPRAPQQAPQMAPQGQPMQQAPQAQLPENTGIGQLPVPSMQSMAGGGITGEPVHMERGVRRFDPGGLTAPVRSINGGKTWFLDVPDTIPDPSVPYYREIPNPMASLANQTFASRTDAQNAYQAAQPNLNNPGGVTTSDLAARYPAITNLPTQPTAPAPTQVYGADHGMSGTQMPGTPTAGAGQGARGTPPPNAAPRAAPATPGLPGLMAGMSQPQSFADNLKMLTASQDPALAHLATAQEHSDVLNTLAAQNGVDLNNTKGYERLDAMDKKSQDLLDRKSNLAIIQAGLGMIKSGNPFEAIASGAGQGIKSYSDAMDQAQAQQAKLMESRMLLDSSTNAMKLGNVKEAVSLAQQGKKMALDQAIANNRDAVQLTDSQAQVNAQLAGQLLQHQVGMSQVGVQQGQLDIARQKLPFEEAEMSGRAAYYGGRNDALGGKLDAAAKAKADAATATEMKGMGILPGTPGFEAMQDQIFRKHYARLAPSGLALLPAAQPATAGFSMVK